MSQSVSTTGFPHFTTCKLSCLWKARLANFGSLRACCGWFTWLAKALPHNAEAGGGLMVAVIQLAITAGAPAGGVLYDGMGYQATFISSGIFLLIATTLSVVASRWRGASHA